MPQAVAGARIALAVVLQAEFVEERVEKLALNFRRYELVRLRVVPDASARAGDTVSAAANFERCPPIAAECQ